MINNYFQKSKPIQNVFLIILFSIVYTTYALASLYSNSNFETIITTIFNFFILISLAVTIKIMMNELSLSKSSNFFAILFIAFFCFFPEVMLKKNVVIATFLSTISMYRFLKIDFNLNSKLSVFDACLFLFTAALFHFWIIIYSVLIVYATIRNYKKNTNIFFVPLIAFLNVLVLFLFFSFLINNQWTETVMQNSVISFKFDYFDTIYKRLTISFYFSFLFIMNILLIFQFFSKPLLVQSALKKILSWLILSITVYIISPFKSNHFLFFSTIPLLMITANYLEFSKDKILKDIILGTIIFLGFLFFILQTFFS